MADEQKPASNQSPAAPQSATAPGSPPGSTPATAASQAATAQATAAPGGGAGQPKVPGAPGAPAAGGAAAAPPKPAPPPGPPAPPPPKNPGFVTCTIDGKEVVVKPGTNVIEAAKALGIDIPYYCYHKRLSIAANCRMCLVEMSNAPGGKLMPACQMPVAEGVAVKTETPRVRDQARATLEFLLLNHPVDCAICDQAGECKLQDYYMKYDTQPSRLDVEKVKKEKRAVLGPLVVLDQERCILCTRCVRFMREVAKQPQLAVAERGNFSYITTFPGQPLDSRYSGNVVDICPVGALTSRDFRFRGRVWFMSAARSICTGCARGCNTFLDYMSETVYRYRPRENEAVNQEWMCDDGRLSYKYVNKDRVFTAREGRGALSREATVEQVARDAGAALKAAAASGRAAVLLSPVASLEDLLAAAVVAKEGLGITRAYMGGRPDGWQDDFLKRADQNPNRMGVALVANALGIEIRPFAELVAAVGAKEISAVWAVGTEVPSADVHAFGALETFVVQATNSDALAREATHLLPAATHAESDGTFVNFEGRAQRFELAFFPRADTQPHWQLAAEVGRAAGLDLRFTNGRDVFMQLGGRLGAALGDFKWDSLPNVAKRRGLVPLAAGTVDGRLPGYRERMPPETSEDLRRALPKLGV